MSARRGFDSPVERYFAGAGFSGVVLLAEDPRFDAARRVWNGMIDRTPALIARCRDALDVRTAIGFARETGRALSVRCGGHNVAGSAVADGAVMIDLSLMRAVAVDQGARMAQASGGCLLRDLDRATTAHGLACPSGVFSLTGLGGLALGGGYGWRCRKLGLTCDHIIGAEVVLADGSVAEVSESQHPDLLWALRGGGGNFGVVTRFTLRLAPAGPALVRSAVHPAAHAVDAMRACRAFAPGLSDDLHLLAGLRRAAPADPVPPGQRDRPVLGVTIVCSAAGRRYYTKSGYLADLCDEAIERLIASSGRNPSATGSIDVECLRGAVLRGAGESAFPQREAPFMVTVSGSWDDPGLDHDGIAWAREAVDSVRAWEHPGAYSNYISQQENPLEASAMYGPAIYARLARVKRAYDPDNVFRSVRGIIPAATR